MSTISIYWGRSALGSTPPRMTPQLWQEVMRFEQYRELVCLPPGHTHTTASRPERTWRFFTARTEGDVGQPDEAAHRPQWREAAPLTPFLADAEALAPKSLHEAGLVSAYGDEFAQYTLWAALEQQCGVPREGLGWIQEKGGAL